MRYITTSLLILFYIGLAQTSFAQKNKDTVDLEIDPPPRLQQAIVFDFSYGIQLPAADMAKYFKYNFSLGGKIRFMTSSNLFLGIAGDYQFSEDIKIDPVSSLRNPEGWIIDKNGFLADIKTGQRGFYLGGSVGYLLPVSKKNKRSGIEFIFSGGYQQHWILIDVLGDDVLQLNGDYKKGYDYMTSGFAMQQYIGYRYMSKNKLLNFWGGFDFLQGFTKNRRNYNFNVMEADDKNHIDLLFGFRIGMSLPIYFYSTRTDNDDDVKFY
ncbi:MAG: hypothetical protein GY810_18715 [Aureispira sp.]|nr:hypothetical protein [Aureispira sp.]